MIKLVKRKPYIAIILGALVLAAILIGSRERSTPMERPERAWVVDAAPALRQTLQPTLELFGSLFPRRISVEVAEVRLVVQAGRFVEVVGER